MESNSHDQLPNTEKQGHSSGTGPELSTQSSGQVNHETEQEGRCVGPIDSARFIHVRFSDDVHTPEDSQCSGKKEKESKYTEAYGNRKPGNAIRVMKLTLLDSTNRRWDRQDTKYPDRQKDPKSWTEVDDSEGQAEWQRNFTLDGTDTQAQATLTAIYSQFLDESRERQLGKHLDKWTEEDVTVFSRNMINFTNYIESAEDIPTEDRLKITRMSNLVETAVDK